MRRCCLAFAALLLLACGDGEEPVRDTSRSEATPSATTSERASGSALYARYCALCHGARGEGYAADDAPSLRSQEFLRSASDAFLTAAIADGRPGTAMSAWSKRRGGPLEDAQIDAIVRHLRSWRRTDAVDVDTVQVNGDSTRGAAVYREQCARCHGERGEGVDAVALANPNLLATASDGYLRYAVEHGRTGTRMPAFGRMLDRQAIDDVVAFVRSFQTRDTAPDQPAAEDLQAQIPALADMDLVINPRGARARLTLREERFVPAAQVARELAAGKRMVILDARATSDWLTGRIPGAIPVPFYELDDIVEALPRDGTWMIAYCGCPHAASGRVVDALRERGFTNTAVLDEGIHHWEQQRYPMTNGLPD